MNGAYFSQTSRTSSEVVNKFLKERMCKEKKNQAVWTAHKTSRKRL